MKPTKTVFLAAALAAAAGLTCPHPRAHAQDADAIDWSALNWDTATLTSGKATPAPRAGKAPATNWTRDTQPDGRAAVSVGHALPTVWDSKVGLDMTLAPPPPNAVAPIDPEKLLPGADAQQSGGAAWANVSAPALNTPLGWDKATIDARIDPLHDTRQLGTSFAKSVTIDKGVSVTLQNGYSVTQTPAPPLDGALPATSSHTSTFATASSARLNLPGGTAVSVGTSLSSAEEKRLTTLSAEQKLFGGVSVTGTLSDTATGIQNRSLTAGFRKTW